MNLYQQLAKHVKGWRESNYPHETFPAIGEILEWAGNPDGGGYRLRKPQIQALETYWYLRLVQDTPKIPDLYRRVYKGDAGGLLGAVGIPQSIYDPLVQFLKDAAVDAVLDRVLTDDTFAKEHKLDALRETLTLAYPSYIFALAMGAGKTALMGAIIASEFAMALEYPEADFVQNALVFAPGKAIIESLRELVALPYDRILPPRFFKLFSASLKLTFTRDGEKDIPVIAGSIFNVVVTNTDKIRIRKESILKSAIGTLFSNQQEDEAKQDVANLRLQKIASLPHLAVFSDEAHHTYGNALDSELKKVRQTVDYLAENTNLIGVVNTTGTPYFGRQLLRDVVVWYGLSEGIRDGILKEVSGNIFAYDFDAHHSNDFVGRVVENFFRQYQDVRLPNGAAAKLAIYFPQTDDLEDTRPLVETKLAEMGLSPTLVLTHTSKSGKDSLEAFNRLNDPHSPHRVILLVNIGTEGWNCPSLFATALARKLTGRNNFVLQAASRCLRQVPGNNQKASIFLSMENRQTLDKQLQETYGETIRELNLAGSKSKSTVITLRKINIPPLVIKRLVRRLVPKAAATQKDFALTRPQIDPNETMTLQRLAIAEQIATGSVLAQVSETIAIETTPNTVDPYAAAVELAAVYRVEHWRLLDELRRLYDDGEIPQNHLEALAQQIEAQTSLYDVEEEVVEQALALVKPDGFIPGQDEDGNVIYTAEISYPIDREHLLMHWQELTGKNKQDLGFHYDPYNFDSKPEADFFEQLLTRLNLQAAAIEDIYFTGALTDPKKTDFFVQYKGVDGRWHNYTPDFVIRCKDGKCLIVEVKRGDLKAAIEDDLAKHAEGKAAATVEGRKTIALQRWQDLNPDRLKYALAYGKETIDSAYVDEALNFVEEWCHE